MSGEGNFNWRFVFPFDYMSAEEKIVYLKKDGPFALDPTEYKVPCCLTLQVWDAELITSDDCLGSFYKLAADSYTVKLGFGADLKRSSWYDCFEYLRTGDIVMDLNKVPRPVKDAKFCDVYDPKRPPPVMNLFKTKRCRGWWPMTRKDEDGELELVVCTGGIMLLVTLSFYLK